MLTLTVVGVDSAEQPCALVTRTVTCSPSVRVVEDIVSEVLEAPILTLLTKNSYMVPPEAVNTTWSPAQTGVAPPTRDAIGAGVVMILICELATVHIDPLTVDVEIRIKSVVFARLGGV